MSENIKLSKLSNTELEEMKKAAHVITNSWNRYTTRTSDPYKYYKVPAHISKIISDDYSEWKKTYNSTPRR